MAYITEKGRILEKGEVISGISQKTGNPWSNQQIVIEVAITSTYSKNVAVRTNKTDILNQIQEMPKGTDVEFEYSVESREWQGKWYTDVNLVSIKNLIPVAQTPTYAPAPQTTSPKTNTNPLAYTREETDPTKHPEDLPW